MVHCFDFSSAAPSLRRWAASALAILAIMMAPGARGYAAADDARVLERIEFRLAGQVNLSLQNSTMGVLDGIVTLAGSVGSVGERERVVRLVSGIVGVRGVISELTVRQSSRPDAGIEQEIKSLLMRRPRFRGAPISVVVAGGVARLAGDVERALDRLDAGLIAAEVEGVLSVENGIRVLTEGLIAPDFILDRVRGILTNPLTFGVIRDLEIEVDPAGIVVLRGTALQPSHRDEAERLVLSVPGVAGVRNGIELLGS